MDYLIRWRNKAGNTFDITNVMDIRITLTKDAKSNSLELTLPSRFYISEGETIFNQGETFMIYATSSGLINRETPSEEELLGVFNILDIEKNQQDYFIKLICNDLTYNALSTLYSTVLDTQTSPELIYNIAQNLDLNGIDQENVVTNIDVLRSDGSAFPVADYTSLWKTSYEVIQELSGTEYTKDKRDYLFWVEPNGTFNWVFPPSDVEDLELFYGDSIKDMKHQRKDSETINMIIFDAGTDLEDTPIIDFEYNKIASQIKGSIKYQPYVTISKILKQDGSITDNTEFRNKAIEMGRSQANRRMRVANDGSEFTSCSIQGRKLNIAKLHKVKSEMFPLRELRLDKIIHTINRNGWVTKLELIEDTDYEAEII